MGEYGLIISIVVGILGVWVGFFIYYFISIYMKYNNKKKYEKEIKYLEDTKNKLLDLLREKEEEIRLRDEVMKGKEK